MRTTRPIGSRPSNRKAVYAVVNCRTAALGGFKARSDHCGAATLQYASCRKRHCPKVEALVKVARRKFLVPILKVPHLDALNERLLAHCLEHLNALEQDDRRLRLFAGLDTLRALPGAPFEACEHVPGWDLLSSAGRRPTHRLSP